MKLLIDISDNTYDAIMARDWKNAGWLFSDELKAIHDGKPFVEVLQKIRQEIVDEQSGWIKGSDPEWHECRRILYIIDNHIAQCN